MDLKKIAIKLAVSGNVDPEAVMQQFVQWIRDDSIEGTLLDVADYSHMHEGPGVVLIAHEFLLSLDEQDGWVGLRFSKRTASDLSVQGQIEEAWAILERAANMLKEKCQLSFNGCKCEISTLDRLHAEDGCVELLKTAFQKAFSSHEIEERQVLRDQRRTPGLELSVQPALL